MSHLLRRTAFGARPDEEAAFSRLTYVTAVDGLVNFDPAQTDVDGKIGASGYANITATSAFSPNTNIDHARQRWLFRMVHSPAPLQEKMALIWHQHFATAYSKIAGMIPSTEATRLMAAKRSADPAGQRGQIDLFREAGMGSFRDLLVEVAKDPAMLYWLDGRLNTKNNPQENFGRELMELFTFGVEHYVEADVYAAARVFSGWNLLASLRNSSTVAFTFNYVANNHDTGAKDFSFPIYSNGSKRIEARNAASGMQDGLDLIDALAVHPETAKRLARRFWFWFVSETEEPDESFVSSISDVYLQNDTQIKPVIRAVLMSPQFIDPGRRYQRYSWPVEFAVRAMKEVGYVGFSVDTARSALVNMGQQLFEPPDVNGWELGQGWFSTGGMLARMNFAAQLAQNQRFALRDAALRAAGSPEALVDWAKRSLSVPDLSDVTTSALLDYARAGGYTGSAEQLLNKAGGLVHLLASSGEFQIV
ncbi:MAG TPA: DUF1800 domain-containing protein [Vicinamibacterales bacterium]|nr:DUF1800 domain-containing protein [Vicinamibacterales bacterium]